MSLARLELGEVETTYYLDPTRSNERIDITFRHATEGELTRSYAQAGLDYKDGEVKAIGSESTFEAGARLEDANIILAQTCILSAAGATSGEKFEAKHLYKPALVHIGKYLRESGDLSDAEKKASAPPASGPT